MGDIRVGKPDTKPDASAHTKGIRQGNELGSIQRDPGFYDTGEKGAQRPTAKSTARKSTGINSEKRNPIDPSMPNLPPN